MLGEFLIYVRTADWENAAKLCKMILIYEPNNPQALQFQSVIAEKVQVDALLKHCDFPNFVHSTPLSSIFRPPMFQYSIKVDEENK